RASERRRRPRSFDRRGRGLRARRLRRNRGDIRRRRDVRDRAAARVAERQRFRRYPARMGRGVIRAALLAGVLAAVLLALTAASGGAASTRHRSPFAGLGTWVDIYSSEWSDPEAAVTAM